MVVPASELETLRDALVRARAKGARTVQTADERAEYRSDAEMAAAIADLDTRIARGSANRRTTVAFASSKGL